MSHQQSKGSFRYEVSPVIIFIGGGGWGCAVVISTRTLNLWILYMSNYLSYVSLRSHVCLHLTVNYNAVCTTVPGLKIVPMSLQWIKIKNKRHGHFDKVLECALSKKNHPKITKEMEKNYENRCGFFSFLKKMMKPCSANDPFF